MTIRHKIGTLSVDAGIIALGDPCYTLPDDASHRTEIAKDWGEFCSALYVNGDTTQGVEPLGKGVMLVVQSGYGDGSYPVYAEYTSDNHIARVIVDFMDEDDDD